MDEDDNAAYMRSGDPDGKTGRAMPGCGILWYTNHDIAMYKRTHRRPAERGSLQWCLPCCREASKLQSGKTCATHDKWTSHPEPVPAWYVNSNPFNSGVSRATHDVVHKVAREGPSLGGRRIEHNNLISRYETERSLRE